LKTARGFAFSLQLVVFGVAQMSAQPLSMHAATPENSLSTFRLAAIVRVTSFAAVVVETCMVSAREIHVR
jgi:hypothetical protein